MEYQIMEQVELLLRLLEEATHTGTISPRCSRLLEELTEEVLPGRGQVVAEEMKKSLPEIRRLLALDVEAAWIGDPAVRDRREIELAYPGYRAVLTYRMAHRLWRLRVPLLPRLLSEAAHGRTGIDIHPGAEIGSSFFIDHGTGVVIGETAVIGDQVKLYQGVTLGGLSTRGGQSLQGQKRHPTLEDRVTVYANATILGGDTVIGHDCVVGANAFVTESLPPCTRVWMEPELLLKPRTQCDGK